MIIRIVRMHFAPDGLSQFLTIFRSNEAAIRSFPGCRQVQLVRDLEDDLCYGTLGHWDSAGDLEQYRNSILFKNVWSSVKPLFERRADAFSLEEIDQPA